MISKSQLLEALPQYKDEWLLINPDQTTQDIVHEVLQAHDEFAAYYDCIAGYFDKNEIKDIASELYQFCKKNLKYNEEPESFQSTSVPQGLLYRGECDCKGYSNFIGGILDGLNRIGRNIKWNYRFASYDLLNKSPHHVFIVAQDENGREIWIDPTPGAQQLQPIWKADKKISAMTTTTTAKHTIGNASIGIDSLVVTPMINQDNINFDGTHRYAQYIQPSIFLSQYRDFGGNRNINEWSVAEQINNLVAQNGKSHTVDGNFVKWIYDNNIRSWNFLFPQGVRPGFSGKDILPADYPRLIMTPDGRLNFDRWVELDDYRNAEIHIMNAWAQAYINAFLGDKAFPLKPADLKGFSQGNDGGEDTRNLFLEHRGDSIFSEIGHWFNDVFNWFKENVILKIGGFVPRNAFLALVGLNVFHVADDLAEAINNDRWEGLSKLWEGLGGNPDKLYNTIVDGAKHVAIENTGEMVDSSAIGEPVTVAAVITAATPILLAVLSFINKDGSLDPYIEAAKLGLQTAFPDGNFEFLDGVLHSNGQPVTFQSTQTTTPTYQPGGTASGSPIAWLQNNPLVASAAVGLGASYIAKKPGQRKPNFIIGLVAGGAIYFLLKSTYKPGENLPGTTVNATTTEQKRQALINWAQQQTATDSAESIEIVIDKFQSMTASEINAVYDYVFNYLLKGIPVTQGSSLYMAMIGISEDYEIFT